LIQCCLRTSAAAGELIVRRREGEGVWMGFAALGIALLMLAVGVAVPRARRAWLWKAVRAEVIGWEVMWRERPVGKLIEVRRVYHPRLRFRDATGDEREIVLDLGDGTICPCDDPVGRPRLIRYNPANPSQAVDWEPLVVWLPPSAAMFAGVACLILAGYLS
jgi:hypothetical protein